MILRRSWGRFLQRRRRVLVGTFAGLLGVSLLAVWAWPATYVAQASVAPAGEEYTGPTHRLVARVTSRSTLTAIAADAGLTPADQLGLVARMALPADPAVRLTPSSHPLVSPSPGTGRPHKLVITTRAEDASAARAAADRIAHRLVDLDAQLRGAKPAESTDDAPPLPQHRVALTDLLQRFPLLTDRARIDRHRQVESEIASEQRAVAGLAARLRGYETKAKRLWALAEEEAREAWLAHRASEAARLAAKKRAAEPPPTQSRPTEEASATSALKQLEDELQRLLSKLTERHPDVRRVRRLLEAERRRVAEARPAPTPEPATPKTTEPAAAAPDGAIADDPPPAAPPPAEPENPGADDDAVPARFLHAARSYGDWLQARNQVDDTRTQLEARREGLQAMTARHETDGAALKKLLEGLPAAERERARLEALIATQTLQERNRPGAPEHAPLLPGDAARIIEAHRPSRFLPWALFAALLASLLLALIAEYQDPTVHTGQELSDLAPVLGVIPHLRGRR